jgi:hypothetical protein
MPLPIADNDAGEPNRWRDNAAGTPSNQRMIIVLFLVAVPPRRRDTSRALLPELREAIVLN